MKFAALIVTGVEQPRREDGSGLCILTVINWETTCSKKRDTEVKGSFGIKRNVLIAEVGLDRDRLQCRINTVIDGVLHQLSLPEFVAGPQFYSDST